MTIFRISPIRKVRNRSTSCHHRQPISTRFLLAVFVMTYLLVPGLKAFQLYDDVNVTDNDVIEEMEDDEDEEETLEDWVRMGALSTEKRLISRLLEKYDQQGKMGRPVVNTADNLTVYFGLSLIQILDVDESNQVLKSSMWYRYQWKDMLLRWNPGTNDNITSARIPSSKIWLPDILLYNFADDRLREQRDALVVVSNDGSILWMPQAILRSSCSFDTKYFPFDVQTCRLKFGSWTYNGNKLNVEFVDQTSFDLSDYVESNEWDIIENIATRNVKYYTCCPQPFPDLTFKLTLRRKTAFYTFILILPCTLLSLLTLVIFWVPPESPAKLQLGMSVFVAFFFLLLVLADFTPRAAASIPLIGAYFCLSMAMITLSTVLSCVVVNMYFRGVRVNRAPAWLRCCIGSGVARVFGLGGPRPMRFDADAKRNRKYPKASKSCNDLDNTADFRLAKVSFMDNNARNNHRLYSTSSHDHCDNLDKDFGYDSVPERETHAALIDEVRKIKDLLLRTEDKKSKEEEKNKHLREWRVIACVTDRIFFVTYITINAVTITLLFTVV